MKKIKNTIKNRLSILLVLSSVLMLNACHFKSIKGNGNVSTEDRSERDFSKLSVSSSLTVEYTYGPEYSVKVEADDNLIKYIQTEVHGSELQVKIKKGKSFRKETKTTVHITAPTITKVDLSGASHFNCTNSMLQDNFEIQASGASEARIQGDFTLVSGDISGASNVTLNGTSKSIYFGASGSSVVFAKELQVERATFDFSGSSSATTSVSSSLKVNLSGASSVYYYGTPTIESELSGSSTVTQK